MSRNRGGASLLIPVAALLLSLGAAVAVFARALYLEPAAPPLTSAEPPSDRSIVRPVSTPRDRVQRTIAADPFQRDRRPPPRPFRLPGEPLSADSAPAQAQPAVATEVRLIGTAVLSGERGFAMCQIGDGAPRLVRPGERIGGYTLVNVAKGRAVFRAADGTAVEVRVPKAGGGA